MTFEIIKKIITILSTGTNLGAFIVTTLCTNYKSEKFIEYTDLSKFFLNLYIFLLLLLMLLHSINPNIIFPYIKKNIKIITSGQGKIYLSSAIILMYFSTESMPQKLFGMIAFVSTLGLLLSELAFNCEVLKQNPLQQNPQSPAQNSNLEGNNI